jgi:hypothetical protein
MSNVRKKYIQEIKCMGINLYSHLSKLSVDEIYTIKEIPVECIPQFLQTQRFLPMNMKYLKWVGNLDTFLSINYLLLSEEDVPSGCVRWDLKPEDKITLFVNSDEVIRKCGEYSNFAWARKEKPVSLAKSQGQGCMMSGFCMIEGSGWLELSPLEFARWRWSQYMDGCYEKKERPELDALLKASREAD